MISRPVAPNVTPILDSGVFTNVTSAVCSSASRTFRPAHDSDEEATGGFASGSAL